MVCKRSIQRYRRRGPAHPSSQTWRTFLANHAHHVWAADLLTVQTLTFKMLYVLGFIAHSRRELVHMNVTANPTAAWVWRQVIEATPWGSRPEIVDIPQAVWASDQLAPYLARLAGQHGPIFAFIPEAGPHRGQLRQRGKLAKVAIIACMRKLLHILNAMMRDQQPWAHAGRTA